VYDAVCYYEALTRDMWAVVDATEHKDVNQYDAMLKAAINKSEKKLARYETAQSDESKQVWGNMASADEVLFCYVSVRLWVFVSVCVCVRILKCTGLVSREGYTSIYIYLYI
jgi:hypothetical protein